MFEDERVSCETWWNVFYVYSNSYVQIALSFWLKDVFIFTDRFFLPWYISLAVYSVVIVLLCGNLINFINIVIHGFCNIKKIALIWSVFELEILEKIVYKNGAFFRRIYFVSRETVLMSKISIILIFLPCLEIFCLSGSCGRGEDVW